MHMEFRFPVLPALREFQERVPVGQKKLISSLLPFLKATALTKFDKEQILNILSQLLVHGDAHITLTIARLFRPLVIDLVARVVRGKIALQGNDHLTQFAAVSASFSLLLPVAPHILGFVLEYFDKSPSIFDKLLSQHVDFSKLSNTDTTWLDVAQTAYRLFSHSSQVFGKLWNWSALFSLLLHPNPRVRWYTVHALQAVMDLSDANVSPVRVLIEEVHQQLSLQEAEFAALESAIMFTDNKPISANKEKDGNVEMMDLTDDTEVKPKSVVIINDASDISVDLCFTKANLCDALVDVCGVMLPKRIATSPGQSKLVYTATSQQNMRALAIAVCQGAPILLEGTTGAGKTSLIDELAAVTAYTNAKVLLGTYVCTEIPGEFRWQPGALTQAVSEGRWIVIEDIDLAPMEVLSVLIPLLETRKLFIPGRGEVIEASPGFQLFATQTLFGSTLSSREQAGRIAHHLWTRVVVEPLTSDELTTVLSTHYPEVKNLVPKIIETFSLLTQAISGIVDERSGMRQLVISGSRIFSTRDLVKWVQRIHLLDRSAVERETSKAKEQIFLEAVDCFCCMVPKKAIREKMIHVIAKVWGVWEDRTEYYVKLYRPDINLVGGTFTVGRVDLKIEEREGLHAVTNTKFAHTGHTLRLLERIAACVRLNEPTLLVGDTGTGKTTTIQYVADMLKQKLIVLNLNQQSDSSDLLGGFKPIEMRLICTPLKEKFEKLFKKTFSEQKNADFLAKVTKAYAAKNWGQFLTLLRKAVQLVDKKVAQSDSAADGKTMRPKLREMWKVFSASVAKFAVQYEQAKNNFSFSFVEGSLVKAVREGYWVLLDEINLATTETLESLSGLLEGGSITLNERGDVEPIARHPNFRIFGCMNPPTDIGKKELPPGIRNRFTEFFVDEMDNPEDLKVIVMAYLKDIAATPPVSDVVDFYLAAKELAATSLTDGANQKPHYSLRTLSRALEYSRMIVAHYGLQRALYEGANMSFLTQLNRPSYPLMTALIKSHLAKKGADKGWTKPPMCPGSHFIPFDNFWIESGEFPVVEPSNYILTESIKSNLASLARILVSRKYPILLQGPTSSGKTSMVEFLAKRTGHRFVRINNHEHTDLQEYLGTYISDQHGKLVFQEGILVEAVRKGYWVVLDELNLAPSEVLEALNRLLDDNRELYIPETQEIVKPHPHFMLFATQNPPGLYGGRKILSRAFRNRFLELHIDDIPDHELEQILSQRCSIPASYCKKLVLIMKDLQVNRQGSGNVFGGKQGYITLRDLFRWAERRPTTWEELAMEGYMLLAERLRREHDKEVILGIIKKHLNVNLVPDSIYACEKTPEFQQMLKDTAPDQKDANVYLTGVGKVVWTKSMKRLYTLVGRCLQHKEPILLVGETGSSKTTICQVFAAALHRKLNILNCHQHTETADFLGGLRPVRGKEHIQTQLITLISQYLAKSPAPNAAEVTKRVETTKDVKELVAAFEEVSKEEQKIAELPTKKKPSKGQKEKAEYLLRTAKEIRTLYNTYCSLFTWYDGPLVQSMKSGELFLIDEISLAEDAVLERLNSVLEPHRLLVLAEKGGVDIEELYGHEDFRILATMNPGGDFGKKELSPAMRNRFTEIWVPSISSHEDLQQIIEERFASKNLEGYSKSILGFVDWFLGVQRGKKTFSLRDILSWVNFMNETEKKNLLSAPLSYVHGACLVLLDGLGVGSSVSNEAMARKLKVSCIEKLIEFLPVDKREHAHSVFIDNSQAYKLTPAADSAFGIAPFFIKIGPAKIGKIQFSLEAPTTSGNVMRVLRAMQLPRAILLEGSPGVGKTSLVTAIAAAAGHKVVRINLSEQTDIMDLLGSDLPVEGGKGGEFAWRDGVFLQALNNGDWVLLDELNLASQSVLEGLNSCLDHRTTVYIPELSREFQCHPNFRVFAAQNPTHQGGGRKGLPKSFLNRFTEVFVDKLQDSDLLFIASNLYPQIEPSLLAKMIEFISLMHHETMVACKFGRKGAPWEFNLRDMFRWCDLIVAGASQTLAIETAPAVDQWEYVDLIFVQRMRTLEDREHVKKTFHRVFGSDALPISNFPPFYHVTPKYLQVGYSILPRKQATLTPQADIELLPGMLGPLSHLMKCVEMKWMCILNGPTASGKTSLIRALAQMTGHTLHEFAMNSSVDTTEILGGFEQVDLNRHKKQIVDSVSELVALLGHKLIPACTLKPSDSESPSKPPAKKSKNSNGKSTAVERKSSAEGAIDEQCVASLRELQNIWAMFNCRSKFNGMQQESHLKKNSVFDKEQNEALTKILQFAQKLSDRYGMGSHVSSLVAGIQAQLKTLQEITGQVIGCFEWIDGLLLQALETGSWILIDNVNFCNPTVLDRLNPLLENDGFLMVNERGLGPDGTPKVVKPHPNFRIFLAMDDRNGEISRAMRNRGIEVCLLEPDVSSRDSMILLNKVGIPGKQLPQAMIDFHIDVQAQIKIGSNDNQTLRHLLQWGRITVGQLQRGAESLSSALVCGMEQVYVRSQRFQQQRKLITNLFEAHFGKLNIFTSTFLEAGLWPLLVSGSSYKIDSVSTTILRQSSVFQSIHQLAQSNHLDKVVTDMIEKLNAVSKTSGNNALVSARDYLSQKVTEKTSLSPALLSLLFVNSQPVVVTEPSQTQLVSIAKSAVRYIVESSSFADWRARVKWLDANISRLESTNSSSAALQIELFGEIAQKVVKQIHEHPVTKLIHDIITKLSKVLGLDPALFETQPFDIRPNSSITSYLNMRVQLYDKGAQPIPGLSVQAMYAWLTYFYDIIGLEISRQFQSLYESYIYELEGKSQGRSKRTSAQTIFAYSKHKVDKRDLDHEVLALLYPFFKAFDECIDSWLNVGLDFHKKEKKPLTMLQSLIVMRNKLWDSLQNTTVFSISDFIVRWHWMVKELGKASANGLVPNDHLTNIITKVSATAIGVQSNLKNSLWKWGGHPQVLKSAELVAFEQDLVTVAKLVESPLTSEPDPKLYVDVEWKKSLIEALATLHFANAKKDWAQIVDSISTVPKFLNDKLNELKKAYNAQFITPTNQPKEEEDESVDQPTKPSPTLHPAYQLHHTPVGVWPLWDHVNVKLESQVLSQIVQLLHPDCRDASSGLLSEQAVVALRGLTSELKAFLEASLTTSSRTAVDLVPYQHLIWMLDATVSSETGAELSSLVHSMWLSFYSRSWKNTFNIAGKLPRIENSIKVLGAYETLLAESDIGEGPARLFHDTQSSFSFHLLTECDNLVISSVPQKIEQLGLMAAHLSTIEMVDTVKNEWTHFAALFCQTIGCFWKSFKQDDFAELRVLLTEFNKQLTTNGVISECVDKIKPILSTSTDERFVKLSKQLLLPCLDIVATQRHGNDPTSTGRVVLGRAWLLLGLFRLTLLVPVHPVDPTAKYSVHRNYVEELIADLESEIAARQRIAQVFYGKETSEKINSLLAERDELLQKKEELTEKVTFRTAPLQFESLFREITGFCTNFADYNKLSDLVLKMDSTQAKGDEWWSVISQESMWQDQTTFAIRSINEKHVQFRDILHPITIAIYQVKHGLRIIADAANQLRENNNLSTRVRSVSEPYNFIMDLIHSLTCFPTLARDVNSTFPYITGKTLYEIETVLLQSPNVVASRTPRNTTAEICSLVLRYCMCRAYVENLSRGYIDSKSLESTMSLLSVVVSEWKVQEEEKKQKEEAAAQVVKYKVKEHSMETQEQIDETKFRAAFPDYFKLYSDLDEENQDDIPLPESVKAQQESLKEQENQEKEAIRTQALRDADLFQLCAIHRLMFTHMDGVPLPLPSADSKKFPVITESDRRATFELSYAAGNLLAKAIGYRTSTLDQTSLGGHLLATNTLFERLCTKPQPSSKKSNKKQIKSKATTVLPVLDSLTSGNSIFNGLEYDIYHHSNVPEVLVLREPLQLFRTRLLELLSDPDLEGNAILLSLEKITNRLLDQPATSPLFQMLVGVELLLRKSQTWEDYAAKHVSIKDHLDTISRLITRWRRMEIESWPSLLKAKEQRHELNALKWWFHLYSAINEQNGGENDKEDKTILDATLETIEQFIQSSNFGEFPTRLKLVQSFANEVKAQVKANVNPVKSSVKFRILLANMLENVHMHYMQFMPEFNKTVNNLREPIVKQLQDHMKLQKWEKTNLIDNYYRLKEFTEKSHRAIIKLAKSYEEILLKSVVKILSKMEPTLEAKEEVQKLTDDVISVSPSILSWQSVRYGLFVSSTEKSSYFNESTEVSDEVKTLLKLNDSQQHRARLPAYFTTMRGLCEKDFFGAFAQKPIRDGVEAIDVLSGTIIERAAQLENDEKANKKMKELAFDDMLLKLAAIGLSYKASAYSKEQKHFAFILQQVNPHPKIHEAGLSLWQRSKEYYPLIIGRLHKMRLSAQTFHKDLVKPKVNKSSAFAEHVFSMVTKQRSFIHEHSEGLSVIRDFVSIFTFGEASKKTNIQALPSQYHTREWMVKQKHHLDVVSDVFRELQLLFVCVPSTVDLHSQMASILSQSSRKIDSCKHRLDELMAKYRQTFGEAITFPICTATAESLLTSNFLELAQVSNALQELVGKVPHAFQHSLANLIKQITDTSKQYEESNEIVRPESDEKHTVFAAEFMKQYDEIVHHLLISFQSIRTRIQAVPRPDTEKDDNGEADEESIKNRVDPLDKGNIMDLQQYFGNCFSFLDTPSFSNKLMTLHNLLLEYAEQCNRHAEVDMQVLQSAQQMVRGLHPLLHQFCNVADRLLVDFVAFHKSVEKLAYVLMSVFNTLYTKGFCKKEEDGEPEQGEGTEMGSGTGLGDGKGEKDISDQIEDQTDLADSRKNEKKEEDEEEEKEDVDEDEGMEMEADFEGDMRDIEQDDDEEKDEDEEEEEEDELDKEMGEIDQKNETVVDEKLWGDEEDEQPDEQEKTEDAPGQGEPDEDELSNKKEEETEKQDKKEKNKEEKEEQKQQKPDENEEQPNSDEESDGEVDDFEEHGDGAEDEGKINEQLEDNEEEDHHIDPSKDEELELPEDLELDQGEEEVPEEEAPPDTMDVDEKDEEEDNGEGEQEDDKQVDEFPEIDTNEEEKKEEKKEENEPENKLDNDANIEEEGENPQEQENNEAINKNEDQEDPNQAEDRPLGVKDATGKLSDVNLEQEDENAKDEEAQASEQGQALPVPSATQEGEFQEALQQQQKDDNEPKPSRPDANPYRSLGDAKKEWEKRLNVQDKKENKSKPTEQKMKEKTPDVKDQEFEFMNNDDEKKEEETQALGPATEEQLQDIDMQDAESKEDENAKQETIEHGEEEEEEDTATEEKTVANQKMKLKMPEEKKKQEKEKIKEEEKPHTSEEGQQSEEIIASMMKTGYDKEDAEEDDEESGDGTEKLLTREDMDKMRQELDEFMNKWREQPGNLDYGLELWRKYEALTGDLAADLCEQLRLILEPTLATKLMGDYRTGKRINMKKVIPYIASQFKKDKIWLRRTKPNKRQYQVMVAVDDTASMTTNKSGQMALEALTMICKAMSRLEVGQLSVAKFGVDMSLLHPFDQPFTDQVGPQIITQFPFEQDATNMVTFLSKTVQMQSSNDAMQLVFIISDGWVSRDPVATREWIREASANNIFIVFIVMDHPDKMSILNMESISIENNKMVRTPMMSGFPFPFYIVLRDLPSLPQILADTVRQWFEMVKQIE